MQRLVTKKLEKMEDRVVAWDPDEYTEAFRQGLEKKESRRSK